MNCIKSIITGTMLGICLFVSCDEGDKIDWNGVEVANAELKTVLQQKGFTFNDEGRLIQDDKVKSAVTLDLSGCNLTDVSGLDVFPGLIEINLANNAFGFAFDFSVLPATVVAVDLTGNEDLYEYSGLVSVVTEENGDETVTTLRALTKLHLPESARHNCDEIVYFYTNNPAADIKIQNAQGALTTYNTLREVPDAKVRAYLQTNFPSMFDETNPDMINIANRILNTLEAARSISLSNSTNENNPEGVQYIVMNPSFKGSQISINPSAACEWKYLRVKPSISIFIIYKISTTYINWTEAENLCYVLINGNNTIEEIDFSASRLFGQRGDVEWNILPFTTMSIGKCPKLKTIVWPRAAKYAYSVALFSLPLLEEADFSNFSGIGYLLISDLPGLKKIAYYTPDGYYISKTEKDPVSGENIKKQILFFAISADIYAHPETKAFLDTYHDNCRNTTFKGLLGDLNYEVAPYDWTQHYQ
ncbi:MAG: hypothetical protein LBF05_03755 [Tannerella sp.]|jgi:hypothetical protein|nr:hypothetical protein [Tannerella sp.]